MVLSLCQLKVFNSFKKKLKLNFIIKIYNIIDMEQADINPDNLVEEIKKFGRQTR